MVIVSLYYLFVDEEVKTILFTFKVTFKQNYFTSVVNSISENWRKVRRKINYPHLTSVDTSLKSSLYMLI